MRKDPLIFFLFVVATLIVYVTLYPFHFENQHSQFLIWNLLDSQASWLDVVMNFYFFLPLGILCGILFHTRSGFLLSFLAATILSLAVEIAQAYIPSRFSSLRDVFLNSFGAFTGMLIAQLPIFDRELLTKNVRVLIAHRGVVLLISLWMVNQFFPFIPVLRFHTLRSVINAPIPWQDLGVPTIEAVILAAFVVFLWAEHQSARSSFYFVLGLSCLIPMQIFLWGRATSGLEIMANLLGLWVASWVLWQKKSMPPTMLVVVAVGLLIWRELQPFTWELDPVQAFGWIPFRATFENPKNGSIRVICLKCFLYWFILRQVHKATGLAVWKCACSLAAFFALAGWSQTHQFDRSPEITDSILCLIGAVPLLSIDDSQDQSL